MLYLLHTHIQNLESVICNPMVRLDDCLRLGLLHTLRYEGISRSDGERIDQLLASRGLSDMDRKVRGRYYTWSFPKIMARSKYEI